MFLNFPFPGQEMYSVQVLILHSAQSFKENIHSTCVEFFAESHIRKSSVFYTIQSNNAGSIEPLWSQPSS